MDDSLGVIRVELSTLCLAFDVSLLPCVVLDLAYFWLGDQAGRLIESSFF